jgi:hypothetical protein
MQIESVVKYWIKYEKEQAKFILLNTTSLLNIYFDKHCEFINLNMSVLVSRNNKLLLKVGRKESQSPVRKSVRQILFPRFK